MSVYKLILKLILTKLHCCVLIYMLQWLIAHLQEYCCFRQKKQRKKKKGSPTLCKLLKLGQSFISFSIQCTQTWSLICTIVKAKLVLLWKCNLSAWQTEWNETTRHNCESVTRQNLMAVCPIPYSLKCGMNRRANSLEWWEYAYLQMDCTQHDKSYVN